MQEDPMYYFPFTEYASDHGRHPPLRKKWNHERAPQDDGLSLQIEAVSPASPPYATGMASLAALETAFHCPICQDLMTDPVIDCDGNSYERNAIMQWLQSNAVSPLTRSPLYPEDLRPNRSLKAAIVQFLQFQHATTPFVSPKERPTK